MTALKEYERLEATGLWRETPQAQLREVIVSFGSSTLSLNSKSDTALSHWSLAAIRRLNKGTMPAIFAPDDDGSETIEIDDEDMVAAIEKVLSAIRKRKSRPGRLRKTMVITSILAAAALATFWLPQALRYQATRVLPAVTRAQIGKNLLEEIQHLAGSTCESHNGVRSLEKLRIRLALPGPASHSDPALRHVAVLRSGLNTSLNLPGGIILLNRSLVEDFEDPDVTAGYIIAEDLRRSKRDPIAAMLDHLGMSASLRLLTTGKINARDLRSWAEFIVTQPRPMPSNAALLQAFSDTGVRATPYAWALDPTGETTLPLIEADPWPDQNPRLVLSDDNWVRLQTICDQ
ncbi:hypothetical protein [Halocynthiibacter namhaensis]|uniref:hypothetical protein n=1 Tax=Halocynthiibacter namhaensis TaxID=1290553 RepID=UPI000579550F|nr:hypothetical protein [Halocynthiibacter namhaensis]